MIGFENELRRHRPYDAEAEQHHRTGRAAALTAFGVPAASPTEVGSETVAGSSTASGASVSVIALPVVACALLGGTIVWWALLGPVTSPGSDPVAKEPRAAVATEAEPTLTALSGRFTMRVLKRGTLVDESTGWFDGAVSRVSKPGSDSVFDGNTGTTLEVLDDQRRAILSRSPEPTDQEAKQIARYGGGLIGAMRWLLDPKNRSYFETPGAKQKGARRELIRQRTSKGVLVGVRVTAPGMTNTVLADRRTGRPARFEVTLAHLPETKVVLTNFDFDVAIDPQLLSLEPPDGYTLDDRTGK